GHRVRGRGLRRPVPARVRSHPRRRPRSARDRGRRSHRAGPAGTGVNGGELRVSRARVRWNTQPVDRAARAGALRGARLAAEHLLTESRAVVPIEEATLERSGTVTVDEADTS